MQKTTALILLQGLCVTLQLVNTNIASITHDASIALIFSAVLAGFQFTLQHLGNMACPPPDKKGETPVCLPKDS
jgi:hypothetical protein